MLMAIRVELQLIIDDEFCDFRSRFVIAGAFFPEWVYLELLVTSSKRRHDYMNL